MIDLGNNPQLNDSGAAYLADALSESKVVRVWAVQTGITHEMRERIDRCALSLCHSVTLSLSCCLALALSCSLSLFLYRSVSPLPTPFSF